MSVELSPIVLFVYNRLQHTKQVLDALSQNQEAKNSILYVYCDGAKKDESNENLLKIEAVRDLIATENRFKEVKVKFQIVNKGLANSVIDGISEVLNIHEKIIVLEDDIVVGKFFLGFMNNALEMYKNEERVYGVTGYSFPTLEKIHNQTYFLPIMSSWGYGTWNDRWKKINFNGPELLDAVVKNKILHKLDFGHLNYYKMLKDHVDGKNDSWAVRFYVSMYLQKGMFLFPNVSLLENIGFDGTGVHCEYDPNWQKSDFYNNENVHLSKIKIVLNKKILRIVKRESAKQHKSFTIRFRKILKQILAPEVIQFLKRKFLKNKKKEEINFLEFPRYTKTAANLYGHSIIIPDGASFHFMRHEIFEEEIYKFNTLKSDPYIIDGGANIGLATIYLKLLYPNSKIVSFEPDPYIFDILKSNIDSYNFSNVELIKKGLWNDNTELFFISEGADAGFIANINRTVKATESIEVVSLKPYLNCTVDFLKLDIEGAETIVLKDIKDELVNIERIFIEYHSFVGQPQSLHEIIEILTTANFRFQISSPGLISKSPFVTIQTYNNMDMQLNIYGIKRYLI